MVSLQEFKEKYWANIDNVGYVSNENHGVTIAFTSRLFIRIDHDNKDDVVKALREMGETDK
jgi:hypothetical protein